MKRLLNNQKYNDVSKQRIRFKEETIKATNQGKALLNILRATNPLDATYPHLVEVAQMQYSQIKFISMQYDRLCLKTIKTIDESRLFGRIPQGFISDVYMERDAVFSTTHKVMEALKKFDCSQELLNI